MPETHTAYMGRLVQLSDEPIEDFIAEVGMVRSLYASAGLSANGLAEHASELREINNELFSRYCDESNTADPTSSQFWFKLIDLGAKAGDVGMSFLDTYGYTRVNRLLAAEYGGAETETVLVLRGIANEVLEKS